MCETATEKTITANRDNSVHGKSSGPDHRDEVHNYPRVEILSNGSYTVAGLFGFNLSDNITSSQTVDNATLRLTIDEIKNANSSNDYHVYGTRACHQFSQTTAATQWIAPRKAQARLS